MEFRLLGPLEVIDDGRPLSLGGGKRRALLALLLLHANEIVPADRLIDGLWGEHPPHTAAKSVHVYVSQLRRELGSNGSGEGILQTRSSGYVAAVDPDALDINRFAHGLSEGERELADGRADRAADRLREALALWRGPPLADFTYEPFAQDAIGRLEDMRLLALETRIEADLALGRHAHVAAELESLVRAHPLREELRRLLMVALYRCGRQADALAVYRSGRALLVDELGLEPGPALRELQEQILAQSPALAAPPTAPTARSLPRDDADPGPAARRAARWSTGAWVVVAGAVVLLAAAVLAARSSESPPRTQRGPPAIDQSRNSLVALDAGGKPRTAVPLPGRAVSISSVSGTVWVATVNSESLTAVDAGDGTIDRTLPLRIRPDAVGAGADGIWVADASRGLLLRVNPGYQDISARVAFRPASAAPRGARGRAPGLAMALAGGAVWIADGSDGVTRVDASTRAVVRVARGRRFDAVAAGVGAVWAVGSATGAIVRLEPRTGRVTSRLALIGRRVLRAPFPVAVAAGPRAIWILNGNTATVTRVDPRTAGIVATVEVGLDRSPHAVAADARGAWVANGDGTVTRIDGRTNAVSSFAVGEALQGIAVDESGLWVTTAAVDHHVAGGAG